MQRTARATLVLVITAASIGAGQALAFGAVPGAAQTTASTTRAVSRDRPMAAAADLARTPPMGWNSWNAFGKNINEDLIKAEARTLVDSGLKNAGYDTIVVDGGWRAATRDAQGNMQADPTRFPHGMKALADYVHSLGLKFGLHQAVGTSDCSGGTPGTQSAPGGEQQDASTFASWGVDYLKYDLCRYQYPASAAPGSADIDAIAVLDGQQPIGHYEAESAANSITGEARTAPCPACSGEHKVTGIGLRNGSLEFGDVTVPRDGDYTLDIRYVDTYLYNARYDSQHRMTLLAVNHGSATPVYYPAVTATGPSIVQGHTASVQVSVQLHQGRNTLTFSDPNSWEDITRAAYQRMADALKRTGRRIVLSISEYGNTRPWLWAPGIGQLWRTTGDLGDFWAQRPPGYAGRGGNSITDVLDDQAGLGPYAGPGHWNNPDMLQVGNGYTTPVEDRSHFSLWALLAAPLMMGTDLRNATPGTLSILSNREVIAVDQDPLGIEGHKVRDDGDHEVWVKPMADGSRAVVLLNRGADAATMSVRIADLGIRPAPAYRVRDLWEHSTEESAGMLSSNVPSHGVAMYRVWPQPNQG